jgi:hypothetical protein
MYRIRSHGTKRIETLPDEELLVVPLSFPSRHIIQNDRTPHMLPCVLLLDANPAFTNNHPQLAFIVERFGDLWVRIDGRVVRDDGGCAFGEDDGEIGLLVLVARVESGLLKLPAIGEDIRMWTRELAKFLLCVILVVLAHCQHVTTGKRRQNLNRVNVLL